MPIPIVLDTNSLLLPFQRKLDLPSEIERLIEAPHFFVVLQQCVDELNEMAQHKKKFSPAARAALTWISKRGFVIEKGFKGRPDDAMLEFCLAKGAMLVSMDAKLRSRCQAKGIKAFALSHGAKLSST